MHFSGPTYGWAEAAGATGDLADSGTGAGAVGAFADGAAAAGVGAGSLATGEIEAGVVAGLEGIAVDFPGAGFADSFPAGATGATGTGSFTGWATEGGGATTGAWSAGGGLVVPQPMAASPKAPALSMARKEGRFIGIP